MKAPTTQFGSDSYSENFDTLINGYGERRDDFAEYLWMEDMESFDKQVLAELVEEEEIEQCMAEMLAEEEARETTYYGGTEQGLDNEAGDGANVQRPIEESLTDELQHLTVTDIPDQIVLQSRLNPDAAEFVPSQNADLSDSSEASDR